MEKFECAVCGCYYWVEDRSDFECPNCLGDEDYYRKRIKEEDYRNYYQD